MTREKQIERQGTLYSDIPANYVEWCDGFQDYDDKVYVEKAFIEGAKWADKTMIDKACDWLQMNAKKYMRSIGGCMYFDVINSVNDFKRAMEE